MGAKAIVAGTKFFFLIRLKYLTRLGAFTYSVRSVQKLRVTHIQGTIRSAPLCMAQIINNKPNPTEPLC